MQSCSRFTKQQIQIRWNRTMASCSGYTNQHIQIRGNSTMNHVLDIQINTYKSD